jgi:hypothetical protein
MVARAAGGQAQEPFIPCFKAGAFWLDSVMSDISTEPYEPSLEYRVHVLACKMLDLDDEDHEDGDRTRCM